MANEIKTLYSDSAKTNAIYPRTKQNAISDADGNTMGNVGFLNATELVSGTNPVNLGINMDLLWTNSSPTSEFPSQTINLDLTSYSLIIIQMNGTTSARSIATVNGSTMFACTKDGCYGLYFNAYNQQNTFYRFINVTNTNIEFGNCALSGTTNNYYCIPYKIYGIKGVINNG